ncbi:MAG: lysophospholipid acyltransferase family protein [Deltaproteobacteria bacterium]|nr:lysophospholipid acyltransferase family protein [Deltaproteobacteria bacterium]
MSTYTSLFGNALKLLIKLLAKAPLGVRSRLGRLAGFIFSLIPTKDRRIAKLQLEVFARGQGGGAAVGRVYASLGQTLLESINLKPILRRPELYIECPCRDEIDRLVLQKKPIVALTAHTGNWDLLAAYIVSLGIPLTTAGRVARNQHFQQILAEIRAGYGVKTIWRADRGGGKGLINDLREHRVVAALIDQDTRVTSVFAPFFNKPVKTPSALISLGKKFNTLFVSAFMFRLGLNRYRVYVEEIDGALSVEQIATIFNQRLEHYLRTYPDQWVWMHKRWRTSPEHGTMSSTQYLEFLKKVVTSFA